jgi:hypothetical protein
LRFNLIKFGIDNCTFCLISDHGGGKISLREEGLLDDHFLQVPLVPHSQCSLRENPKFKKSLTTKNDTLKGNF